MTAKPVHTSEAGAVFREGDRVSLDIEWPNGRTSAVTGILSTVYEGEAYVHASIGHVVGPVDSLEHVNEKG